MALDAALRAQRAAEVAGRGRAATEAARAALAGFDGLDAEVAGHHANLLRAGGLAGRAALPPDLAEARRRRADAEQDLGDATATVALLAADAQTASAAADLAADAVRLAMDRVMQAAGADLLEQMRAAEGRAGGLRVMLVALAGRRTSVDPPLDWALQQIAHDPAHDLVLAAAGPNWPAAAATWLQFRAALAADPDAVLAP